MVGPETKIAQKQLILPVAEKGRLPAPTEAILPILPFDKAILMIIARYSIPLAARLGTSLPEVVAEGVLARHRVASTRGRGGSRGSSRRHSSRRCGVCEECRNTQGPFVRNRCRDWIAGQLERVNTAQNPPGVTIMILDK